MSTEDRGAERVVTLRGEAHRVGAHRLQDLHPMAPCRGYPGHGQGVGYVGSTGVGPSVDVPQPVLGRGRVTCRQGLLRKEGRHLGLVRGWQNLERALEQGSSLAIGLRPFLQQPMEMPGELAESICHVGLLATLDPSAEALPSVHCSQADGRGTLT